MSVVLSPSGARHEPGPGLAAGRAAAQAGRGPARLHRPHAAAAGAAHLAQHPVRRHRPGRRAAAGHPVRRIHQLGGRTGRDAASDRARAHPDRRRQRAHPHALLAGRGSTATGPRWAPPACRSGRTGCTWATSWRPAAGPRRAAVRLGRPPDRGVRRQRRPGARRHRGGDRARPPRARGRVRRRLRRHAGRDVGAAAPHDRAPADPAHGGGGGAHRAAARGGRARRAAAARARDAPRRPRQHAPPPATDRGRSRTSGQLRDRTEIANRGSFR